MLKRFQLKVSRTVVYTDTAEVDAENEDTARKMVEDYLYSRAPCASLYAKGVWKLDEEIYNIKECSEL